MEVCLEFKICYPLRQSTNSWSLQISGEIPNYFVILISCKTQPWQQQVLKYDDYDEIVWLNRFPFLGKWVHILVPFLTSSLHQQSNVAQGISSPPRPLRPIARPPPRQPGRWWGLRSRWRWPLGDDWTQCRHIGGVKPSWCRQWKRWKEIFHTQRLSPTVL